MKEIKEIIAKKFGGKAKDWKHIGTMIGGFPIENELLFQKGFDKKVVIYTLDGGKMRKLK